MKIGEKLKEIREKYYINLFKNLIKNKNKILI